MTNPTTNYYTPKQEFKTNQFGRVNNKFLNYKIDTSLFSCINPGLEADTPVRSRTTTNPSRQKSPQITNTPPSLPKIVQNRNQTNTDFSIKVRPFALQEIAAKSRREASILRKKVFTLENEINVKNIEIKMVRERFDKLNSEMEEEKIRNCFKTKSELSSQSKIAALENQIKSLQTKLANLIRVVEIKQKNIVSLQKTLTVEKQRKIVSLSKASQPVNPSRKSEINWKDSFKLSPKHTANELIAKIEARVECYRLASHFKEIDKIKICALKTRLAHSDLLSVSQSLSRLLKTLRCHCLQLIAAALPEMLECPYLVKVLKKHAFTNKKKSELCGAVMSKLFECSVDNKSSFEFMGNLLLSIYRVAHVENDFFGVSSFIFDGHFNRIMNNCSHIELRIVSLKIANFLMKDPNSLSFISTCFIDEGDSPLIPILKDYHQGTIDLEETLNNETSRNYRAEIVCFLHAIWKNQKRPGLKILANIASFATPQGIISLLADSVVLFINMKREMDNNNIEEENEEIALREIELLSKLVEAERTCFETQSLIFHFEEICDYVDHLDNDHWRFRENIKKILKNNFET